MLSPNVLLRHSTRCRYKTSCSTTKTRAYAPRSVPNLQQRKEYHSGAVLWSPRKLREARVRERVKQRDAEEQKLQKTRNRDLKAAATLYKKKMAEEAKVLRKIARERAAEESKARAAERVTARALKKQQRDAATSQKSRDTPSKGKQITSQSAVQKRAPKRGVVGAGSCDVVPSPLPEHPLKTTSQGRRINVPKKFR
jgi:hypothetical protein